MFLTQVVGRWSTAEIHDTVAAIARQPAYATPLRRSLLGRALSFLFNRFADLVALLNGSREFRWAAIVATILIVLAVAGRVIVSRQLDVFGNRAAGRARLSSERRDYWTLSTDLAAAGDFTGACHALYAAVIETLARDGSVKFHASKTSGDYGHELRRRDSPAFQSFRTFARQFDRIVYGASSATADDYELLARAAKSVTPTRNAA